MVQPCLLFFIFILRGYIVSNTVRVRECWHTFWLALFTAVSALCPISFLGIGSVGYRLQPSFFYHRPLAAGTYVIFVVVLIVATYLFLLRLYTC